MLAGGFFFWQEPLNGIAVKSPGTYPFWRSSSGICRITVSTACFQASKVFGTTWKSLMPCRPAKRRYGAISLATVGMHCDMNSMALMAVLQSE